MDRELYMNQVKLKLQEMSVNWRDEAHQGILTRIESHLEHRFAPGPEFHAGFAFALICFNKGLESFVSLNNLPVDPRSTENGIPESKRLAPKVPTDGSGIGERVLEEADTEVRSSLGPASWDVDHEGKTVGLFFPLTHRFHAEQLARTPSQFMSLLYRIVGPDHTVFLFLGEEANCIFDSNTSDYRN
jgi:hypothetical protein